MAKKNHMGVDEQLYNAILEVLKRNYSSSLTAAKVEKACGEALTAGLRVAASMAEAIGIPNVEMLCQARNQIEANIESLKEGISKEKNFDMLVYDLRSCIDSSWTGMVSKGEKAKDIVQRAAAKWFAHYVAMNYGQGEEQQLTGICNELKHEAIEEFVKLDVDIQSMGDALLKE